MESYYIGVHGWAPSRRDGRPLVALPEYFRSKSCILVRFRYEKYAQCYDQSRIIWGQGLRSLRMEHSTIACHHCTCTVTSRLLLLFEDMQV